jgi:hypothetical protein
VGIGIGIVLIAVGAILTWGVTADAEGVDVTAVGVILMVVGAISLLLSLLVFERWSPVRRRRTYVDDRPDVVVERPVRRTTVVEDDGPPPL